MNDTDPAIPLGNYAQVDDPDISQTSGNHETCQTLGVCDMALVQVEATAFLVGEESFDATATPIPIAGFFGQFQIGDQIDRLFVTSLPPGDGQDWAVILESEGDAGQAKAFAWLHAYLVKGEPCPFDPQLDVLGHAAGIVPAVAIQGGLQGDAIELAM
jgi:hypothetical protein